MGECINVQFYFVEEGRYGGLNLNNSAFVLVSLPKAPGAAPSPSILYVDQRRSAIHKEALTALVQDMHGGAVIETAAAKLIWQIKHDHHKITIPDVLLYKILLERPADLARPAPEIESHLYPWLSSPRQWITERVTYVIRNKRQEYRGTNALFARFQFGIDKRTN